MRTVLVVDDEWAIADWLEALLRDEGYHVLVASNGRQALDMLAGTKVDLVLTDFMMPILDGPGLIGAMKEEASLAAIPVIVISSLGEASIRERCSGFAAFLRKPFREAQLLETIRAVI